MADRPLTSRLGTDADMDACLEVLCGAYGRDDFSPDWFAWKHQSSPWGRSRVLMGYLDDELVGVAFAMAWPTAAGSTPVTAIRMTDGATTPAARGRGVLRVVLNQEIQRWNPETSPAVLYVTATPIARASHVKNAAVALQPLTHRLAVPRAWPRARLAHGDDILDRFIPDHTDRYHTAWSPAALRWRLDPRTGHSYEVAALATSDRATGLVYRVAHLRAVRTLVPVVAWGAGRELAVLVASVMRETRCVVAVTPLGPGTADLPLRPVARQRSNVLVCVWDRLGDGGPWPPTTLDSWAYSMADLEGLI